MRFAYLLFLLTVALLPFLARGEDDDCKEIKKHLEAHPKAYQDMLNDISPHTIKEKEKDEDLLKQLKRCACPLNEFKESIKKIKNKDRRRSWEKFCNGFPSWGIAMLVIGAVVLAAVLCWFFFMRRRG